MILSWGFFIFVVLIFVNFCFFLVIEVNMEGIGYIIYDFCFNIIVFLINYIVFLFKMFCFFGLLFYSSGF